MKYKPRFTSLAALLALSGALLAPLSASAEVTMHYNLLNSSQMNGAEFGRLQMEIVNHGTETLTAATASIDDPDGMHASFSKGALALGDLAPEQIKIVEADFSTCQCFC